MKNRRIWLGVLVAALCVAALVWAVAERREKAVSVVPVQAGLDESWRDLRNEIYKSFQEAARILNEGTPKRLEGTALSLKSVLVGSTPSMTYRYIVHGNMQVTDKDKEPVVRRVCSEPEMRDYMEYGVYYDYVYESEKGVELFSFRVDEAACRALDVRVSQSPWTASDPAENGGSQTDRPAQAERQQAEGTQPLPQQTEEHGENMNQTVAPAR